MKLVTKELEKKFAKFPFGSQDGKGMDAEVLVKYFNPYGNGTWLITEAEKQDNGEWILYGYCHLYDWEWGEVSLKELESIRIYGCLGLERDLYAKGTVKDLADIF